MAFHLAHPMANLQASFSLFAASMIKPIFKYSHRLTRLFRKEGFLDALREMNSQADIWHLVRQTELSLMLPG